MVFLFMWIVAVDDKNVYASVVSFCPGTESYAVLQIMPNDSQSNDMCNASQENLSRVLVCCLVSLDLDAWYWSDDALGSWLSPGAFFVRIPYVPISLLLVAAADAVARLY
jgi:hypothetical protein